MVHFHVQRQLAEYIDIPPDEVTALFIGLNHLTFIFDLRWKGQDLWPLIREKITQERANAPTYRLVLYRESIFVVTI